MVNRGRLGVSWCVVWVMAKNHHWKLFFNSWFMSEMNPIPKQEGDTCKEGPWEMLNNITLWTAHARCK